MQINEIIQKYKQLRIPYHSYENSLTHFDDLNNKGDPKVILSHPLSVVSRENYQ